MEKMEAGLRGLCIRETDVKSQILVTKYYSKDMYLGTATKQ